MGTTHNGWRRYAFLCVRVPWSHRSEYSTGEGRSVWCADQGCGRGRFNDHRRDYRRQGRVRLVYSQNGAYAFFRVRILAGAWAR